MALGTEVPVVQKARVWPHAGASMPWRNSQRFHPCAASETAVPGSARHHRRPTPGPPTAPGPRLTGQFRRIPTCFRGTTAPAHHHAHQHRPGGLRLLAELVNEIMLLLREQIGITQQQPVQYLLEVVEVVKRIRNRVSDHSRQATRMSRHWLYIQTSSLGNFP